MQTSDSPDTSRYDHAAARLILETRNDVVLSLRLARPDEHPPALPDTHPIRRALDRFLSGEARTLDVPCEAVGTPFQCAVWQAMSEVRWGELTTYAALAVLIGRPGSARAVGQAVAAHPAPLLVGGHRVLAGDGRIAGRDAASRVWTTALLRLEGHVVHEGRLLDAARAA